MGRQLAEDYGARKLIFFPSTFACMYVCMNRCNYYYYSAQIILSDFFETSAKCDDNITLVFKQFG